MYVPQAFAELDPDTLYDFIESHSFATLVSMDGAEPTASHLPLLLDRDAGPHGALIGHMAKANPQWKQADGQTALAIFHGPHVPISATWYGEQNVVPTWNYVVVHASGILRLESDPRRLREIVERYVAFYESQSPQPWSMDQADAGFLNRLLDGIVGFEIAVDRLEGKWKLNQNHDPKRRKRVIDALRAKGGSDAVQIADLMSKAL